MKSRKRIGIILAMLGVLVAIGTGYYVYETSQRAEELDRQLPKVEVVVAIADLAERAPVPAAAVEARRVPEGMVPLGAATNLDQVVGKFPLTPIYKNEIVNNSKLADSAGKTGPAFTLKPGMVAYTYAGTDLLNATGAIRAGDRVDMLLSLNLPKGPGGTTATTAPQSGAQQTQQTSYYTGPGVSFPVVSQTFMQNLEVIRVGSYAGAAAQGDANSKQVTFEVSHQDALILKWAKDAGGTIDLVLRHPSDKEPVDTEAVTGPYIFKKFKFQLADPIQ